MTDGDAAVLRSNLGELCTALHRFSDMLASTFARPVSTGPNSARAVHVRDAIFDCANGHAKVVHFTPDCPVCAMRRRAGYSEKWCETCEEITAHVGGLHVHASCVICVSHRQVSDALRSSRRSPEH